MPVADDFAAAAIGLYTLFSVTGDEQWYTSAEGLVAELRSAFADDEGGFFATRQGATGLITRPKNLQDNPTPSDNALALEALLVHASYTGDFGAIEEATATMRCLAASAMPHPSFGGYGLAVWLSHLAGIKEVAIVGDNEGELRNVVWSTFRPDVVIAFGDGNPSPVPLLADRPATGEPLAYVCEGLACDLPTSTSTGLERQLTRRTDG